MSNEYKIPLIARGQIFTDYNQQHGGRRGGISFSTPDASKHLNSLVLQSPSSMRDLHSITFEDILDYLEELGGLLSIDKNEDMAIAMEISKSTSGLPDSVLEALYREIPTFFKRERVREIAEQALGLDFIEGWVPRQLDDGRIVSIRAFGARSVHIIAGNLPSTAPCTVIRNAITRSDALIKTPSNDPMTAVALIKTMTEMAPDHPLTKHVAVSYWRGGDEDLESRIFQPRHVEKIIAWGGFSSIKHIAQYMQPGIDIITLDPKLSASIIGKEALESVSNMEDVAWRIASDIGAFNQEGCVNARVIYVECNCDNENDLEKLNNLGELVQRNINKLPAEVSNTPKQIDLSFRDEVDALQFSDDCYQVFGEEISNGTVIVSQLDEQVDFASKLNFRVANIVPVKSIETAIGYVTSDTQTIGVYPDELKMRIRDELAYHGGQRIVNLGYAASLTLATPQDGIEPVRRMAKWILDEQCDVDKVHPLWKPAN